MQINYNNEGKFEKLYPITLSENVKLNNGKNVEEWKMEVDDNLNNIEDEIKNINTRYNDDRKSNILWKGNLLMNTGETVTPSKKLTDCKNGWILGFKFFGDDHSFNYHYIPKEHTQLASVSYGAIKFLNGAPAGAIVQKYLYVYSDKIKGHASNITSGNEKIELMSVIEF